MVVINLVVHVIEKRVLVIETFNISVRLADQSGGQFDLTSQIHKKCPICIQHTEHTIGKRALCIATKRTTLQSTRPASLEPDPLLSHTL